MPHTLSCFIIENDPSIQNYLQSFLNSQFPSIHIGGIYDSAQKAIINLAKSSPDLVIMDIELNNGTAFDILDTLVEYDFEIIFISGYEKHVSKAMEYYNLNFLHKPIDLSQLTLTIQRYLKLNERIFSKHKYTLLKEFLAESKILINTGNQHISLEAKNILKCEADSNYTYFFTLKGEKYLASKHLKYYDELLSPKGFFRANRSTLININHIQSIYKKETIILSNKDKISVSVRNKTKLNDLIKVLS
ncbi:LytR/AlgR family response regulator transcription factor [Aquimarina rhabdastrellae]